MRCSSCDFENVAGKKFCIRCGVALHTRCPKCNCENPLEASFCGECGAELSAETAVKPVIGEYGKPHAAPEGERRHMTVLFCDLVGSTEIASHLDPEEWREIVGEYHKTGAQAIERFGGHVAQYLGDGVMAFFGYPEAHDNDAERAVRAGLAIQEAITKLNEHPVRSKLAARVGVDSGTVVVGAGAGKDTDVFGDTPNIAARVQSAAEPGTVVITDTVYRLISGLFVVEGRGAQALKGIERPVQLYRVVQPSGVRGRLEAVAASRGLTPFVGREDELRLLVNRWERALDNEGQVALIIGEAGIGKSRLVQRFREQIAGMPHTWVEAAAGAFFQNTPFYAVTEMLRELRAWHSDESAEEQLTQLEIRLELAGVKPAEALQLIAPLLNLPLSAKYPPSTLSPEQQRRRLLATLVEWVLGAAHVQPVVITVEDLHWADPSTLELLQLLVEQGATEPLLLLYTARPEFRVPWPLRAHHTQITLNRLNSRNVHTMVRQVAAQKILGETTIAAVVERTGGVPLFVEELTRALLESGKSGFTHEIPITLHDSLMARLDRLGAAKEVAQVGSVIGGEFSYDLLHTVHPIAEEDLQRALRKLADAELLYVRGIAPDAMYLFKHALVREAAYNSLLKTRRRELHQRLAQIMTEKFRDIAELQPELVAHHYTEAASTANAIEYWHRAGKLAVQRSANIEAIGHLTRGLDMLNALPDSPGRAQQELALRMTMSPALLSAKGYGSPEVARSYRRALELCRQIGETPQRYSTLIGIWISHLMKADLYAARELGEQLIHLAHPTQDPSLLVGAHWTLGETLFFLGEFNPARVQLEQGIALYDFQTHQAQAFLYGQDHGMTCLVFDACVLWLLGYPERALQRAREARTLAYQHTHLNNRAFVIAISLWVFEFRREMDLVRQGADTLIALCTEQDFPYWLAFGNIVRGWIQTDEGNVSEGIGLMSRALEAWRATGAEIGQPHWLALLGEAYRNGGRIEEGLTALAKAMATLEKTEERMMEAELYRLKGELMLKKNDSNSAEAQSCFERAIEIARKQSAKSWELRATVSLARLLAKQDKRGKARRMLSEIYNWFTEGFDTADLKEAKALLDELRI